MISLVRILDPGVPYGLVTSPEPSPTTQAAMFGGWLGDRIPKPVKIKKRRLSEAYLLAIALALDDD